MKLLSVNTSGPKLLEQGDRKIKTGILKMPVEEPVQVGELGLEGDVQVSKKHHGGPDQALYLYSAEDYAWFSEQVGRDLAPGTFGENLTLSGFGTSDVYIGDRFVVGEVLLEVTAPRIPCATFAARMNDTGFVKRFKEAERPGVYVRVLRTGEVHAGDEITYERGGSDVSALELFRSYYRRKLDAAALERILAAPIAERARRDYEHKLERLQTSEV